MGISGNIKTMALSELLQWLSQGQKTGTLLFDGKKVQKRIFFEEGVIIASASTDPNEYLGHFLVSHGYIDEKTVNEAVARQKAEGQLIGKILVSMGALDEEDLQQMLQLKSEESIYDIFTWDEGEFRFLDDELPAETFIRMNLDVQRIVLEGSRRMDEWNRIREWVPSPMAVPVLMIDPEQAEMDEVDQRILAWVDDDRTVEEISHGAQTSVFMISQILAQHVQEGHLKMIRPRIIEVDAAPSSTGDDATGPIQPPPQAQQMPPQQQVPQGYPQMMPQGYPQMMPQGYPQQQILPPGYDPPSGALPIYQLQQQPQQQQGGGSVGMTGGRTLHFAGGGGPAPAAAPQSEAEELIQKAESALRLGELEEALNSFRKAKDAQGSGPSIEKESQDGEKRVSEALENNGVKLSAVPKLKCSLDELTELDISPQEGFMLTRVDGSYDITSILKMSPMPRIDAQILFWKLKKSGHVGI